MEEQKEELKLSKGLDELKKDLKKELIFGKDRVFKLLRLGKISKVYLASNVPEEVKSDLEYYKKIGKFEVIDLEIPNDELGVFCKKQFSVSVIGFQK